MTRKTRKINTSLSSCNSNEERIKLLSETREILDYFYANTSNSRISPWFFVSGIILSSLIIFAYYYIKNNKITSLSDNQIILVFMLTPVLFFLLLAFFQLIKIKQLGRVDDIIIQKCKNRSDWSVHTLSISLGLISSIQESYEKRLGIFKLICGAFAFIIALSINRITDKDTLIFFRDIIVSDTYITNTFLFIITCISSIIVHAYVECAFLIYHINICSKIKSSIGLLTSVSDDKLPE